MRFPKWSCSTCGKPCSRKGNLIRHIGLCHGGIGECLPNWDFPIDGYRVNLNKQAHAGINHQQIYSSRSEQARRFPSKDSAVKPDYDRMLTEEFVKEIGRMEARDFINQQIRSTRSFPFYSQINQSSTHVKYNPEPAADIEIFGFRGYVCDKCLMFGTRHVAFPKVGTQAGIRTEGHICNPQTVTNTEQLIDKFGVVSFLYDKIPKVIKQKVNSWTRNNNYLKAAMLPSPPEESIKLSNSASPASPFIVFQYSKQRQITLHLANENKNKDNYLIRAITKGKTLLSEDELTNFLENMKDATFGIITVYFEYDHHITASEDKISQQQKSSQSYFVYITTYSPIDHVLIAGNSDVQFGKKWQANPLADFVASIKNDLSSPLRQYRH